MYHLLPLKAAASSIQASLISHDISFLISNPFNWARVLGHRRRRDASIIFNHHRPLSLEESHCCWRITVGEHRSYLHALSVMWRWTEMRWHKPALEPRRSPPPTTTDTDLHHLLPRTTGVTHLMSRYSRTLVGGATVINLMPLALCLFLSDLVWCGRDLRQNPSFLVVRVMSLSSICFRRSDMAKVRATPLNPELV